MALNVIYSDVESERRPITVPTDTAPGTPLIYGGRPMVTLTGSGDYDGNEITLNYPGGSTVIAGGSGGVGLGPLEAVATPTGTFAFDVAGATDQTAPGTAVYITSGGTLTLTSGGNTLFGIVEFFRGELSQTDTAVTIGVNLG